MQKLNLERAGIPWLERRTIILGPSGSYAHGTNTENSDRDYRGVCIPPTEYFFGLESFNEYNTAGGKTFKNTKDDVDVTISHITKFVRDAMKGHPNSLDLLFLRPQDFIKVTQLGRLLIGNRHLFLTQATKGTFAGFANGQVKLLKHKGYDPKIFAMIVMLLDSAREILETGDYSTYRPIREFLLECRSGQYTEQEAYEIIEHYDSKLKVAADHTELPHSPDYIKINSILMTINEVAITEGIR